MDGHYHIGGDWRIEALPKIRELWHKCDIEPTVISLHPSDWKTMVDLIYPQTFNNSGDLSNLTFFGAEVIATDDIARGDILFT